MSKQAYSKMNVIGGVKTGRVYDMDVCAFICQKGIESELKHLLSICRNGVGNKRSDDTLKFHL